MNQKELTKIFMMKKWFPWFIQKYVSASSLQGGHFLYIIPGSGAPFLFTAQFQKDRIIFVMLDFSEKIRDKGKQLMTICNLDN